MMHAAPDKPDTGYISRTAASELHRLLEEYPVVSILGPRQSGKTTLARTECPGFSYANLEDPEVRSLAAGDPRAFFSRFPCPAIIDEAQHQPQLLSYIQAKVDEAGKNGMFIITGSNQLRLGEALTQTLAGRVAELTLLPFSLEELGDRIAGKAREDILFTGFLPRISAHGQEPGRAYRNYLRTYVERDLRTLINVKDLSKFEIFLQLLAGRTGNQFVASSIASEVGVSYKTVQEWTSVLEASWIVFRLQPYFENYGKRITKAPKLYFYEPGLAIQLLGLDSPERLVRDPLFGALFENMVIVEAIKARLHRGKNPGLYFFRDSTGTEVDLIIDRRPHPIPVEIKSATTYHPEFSRSLERFNAWSGSGRQGVVVFGGDLEFRTPELSCINFRSTSALVSGL